MDHHLASYLSQQKGIIDAAIDKMVPREDEHPRVLHTAMRYSLFAGGKRIRPILALAGASLVGGESAAALPLAVAIECIHTYSLIHDDLPAMDNDDMRRGKPTAHKVYGEAIAILAGDALLNLAFEILVSESTLRTCRHDRLLKVIACLSRASGSFGLIGGQVVDMLSEGQKVESKDVDFIMKAKTAELISASMKCGAIFGGGNAEEVECLCQFGEKLGIAFQIRDDILDHEGDSSELGKTVGKDQKAGKATYPSVLGLADAKARMVQEIDAAMKLLDGFGDNALYLRLIASYIGERSS